MNPHSVPLGRQALVSGLATAFLIFCTATASAQISRTGTSGTTARTGGTGGQTGQGGSSLGGTGTSNNSGVFTGTLGDQIGSLTGAAATSAATSAINSANPFRTYYYNPYALGLGATTGSTGFGMPVYGNSLGSVSGNLSNTGNGASFRGASTSGTRSVGGTSALGAGGRAGNLGLVGGSQGGLGNGRTSALVGGIGGGTNQMGSSMMTSGLRRAPAYTANLGFSYPSPGPLEMRNDLTKVLRATESLKSRDGIKVLGDGQAIVLQGVVADSHEKKLAEAMIRLSPGVRNVRNELEVRETLPPPRTNP